MTLEDILFIPITTRSTGPDAVAREQDEQIVQLRFSEYFTTDDEAGGAAGDRSAVDAAATAGPSPVEFSVEIAPGSEDLDQAKPLMLRAEAFEATGVLGHASHEKWSGEKIGLQQGDLPLKTPAADSVETSSQLVFTPSADSSRSSAGAPASVRIARPDGQPQRPPVAEVSQAKTPVETLRASSQPSLSQTSQGAGESETVDADAPSVSRPVQNALLKPQAKSAVMISILSIENGLRLSMNGGDASVLARADFRREARKLLEQSGALPLGSSVEWGETGFAARPEGDK